MALDNPTAQKVLAQIDRDELAQLGADLTSIPSPTGQEKAIGEFILTWFEANGLGPCARMSNTTAPTPSVYLKVTAPA